MPKTPIEIEVVSSPGKRLPSMPMVKAPPQPFASVRKMTGRELHALGCGTWDEPDASGRVLMLFPHEWYDRIPNGFAIEDINGGRETFQHGDTDNDQRFGCLAYGIRVNER